MLSRILVALCLLLAACADSAPTLTVRVYTGLVPGPEFRLVQTSIVENESTQLREMSEALAHFGNDYARGHDVGAFALPKGRYRVRVRLLRPNGSMLIERVVALSLNGDTVLPVHITRDCVGVVCPSPGGDTELSTCLAGRCVDPRCESGSPEFCPELSFCRGDSDCSSASECAESLCSEGLCTPALIDGVCDELEWCNPDLPMGCMPLTPENGDADCGTICTLPDEPCRFGYWNCPVEGEKFCDVLSARPVGVACDVDRICDLAGECVPGTSTIPGITVSPATLLTTTESGGTSNFTVRLDSVPSAEVTIALASDNASEGSVAPAALLFTPLNWDVPQTVTVTGVDDALRDGDVAYHVTTSPAVSSDAAYSGRDAIDVSVVNTDNDSAGVTASTVFMRSFEAGGSTSFTLTLNAIPTAAVTLAISSTDVTEGTVSPTMVTITPEQWDTGATLSLNGVDDADVDGDRSYEVLVHVASSDDADFAALSDFTIPCLNIDDETPSIMVTPAFGTATLETFEFGSDAEFTIQLSRPPSASVTIPLTSMLEAEGSVAPSSVTFTTSNWSTPQAITVMSHDDLIADGDCEYLIVTAPALSADPDYDGLDADDVAVVNYDDDYASIYINATEPLMTTESGGSDTFTVVLTSQPTHDVTISFESNDLHEGLVSPTSVTFTAANWNIERTVTVTGVDDFAIDNARNYRVITSWVWSSDPNYNGYALADIAAINADDDVATVTITPTSGLVVTEAGGTATFNVVLGTMPSADVAIILTSTDTTEGNVSTAAVLFNGTNWNVPQTVTVTGVDDFVFDGDVAYTIDTQCFSGDPNYSGQSVPDVAVTTIDDDQPIYTQQAYVKASNTVANQSFGWSVAVSGDGNTIAVGAPGENSNAVGINGDQSDHSAAVSGAVYVYARVGAVWSQQAYIKTSNSEIGDQFGFRVALSADGNTLAATANQESSGATGVGGNQADNTVLYAGAVFVFARSGTTWSQQAYIKASNSGMQDYFGEGLSIAADGNTLAIGAPHEASAAMGVGGNQADNSVADAGAVYVFTRAGTVWSQEAYVKASNTDAGDRFGEGLSIAGDGNTMAVGAPVERSESTGINGSQANTSGSDTAFGAAYVFVRAAGVWSQQAYVKASNTGYNDLFGVSVSLTFDGNLLAVGAQGESSNARVVNGDQSNNANQGQGAVYVFSRAASTWTQDAYLKASNGDQYDYFGRSVSFSSDGTTIGVGAYNEASTATGSNGNQFINSIMGAGAMYIFRRVGPMWRQRSYIKATNPNANDLFAENLAVSADGETIIVGARWESSGATGIGGNQADNSAALAGAAYVFGGL